MKTPMFFKLWFAFVFFLVMCGFGVTALMTYNCYSSGDRDSMACYMISDRVDHTLRIK